MSADHLHENVQNQVYIMNREAWLMAPVCVCVCVEHNIEYHE